MKGFYRGVAMTQRGPDAVSKGPAMEAEAIEPVSRREERPKLRVLVMFWLASLACSGMASGIKLQPIRKPYEIENTIVLLSSSWLEALMATCNDRVRRLPMQ